MSLDAARLDAIVWSLIFGGLLVVAVGISLQRDGAGYGCGVAIAGALVVAVGVFLIWLRSHIRDPES